MDHEELINLTDKISIGLGKAIQSIAEEDYVICALYLGPLTLLLESLKIKLKEEFANKNNNAKCDD